MSCSSIKNRFDKLSASGDLNFDEAVTLYNELKGSLEAHRLELEDLRQTGNITSITHLQQHISDGESMLSSLQTMTLQ